MLLVNMDEVMQLPPLVDKFFYSQSEPMFVPLMDEVVAECLCPTDALIEFFSHIEVAPADMVEEMLDLFFDIPYEQMPLYATPRPMEELTRAKSLCPPLEEGPYPWQTILAQWRLSVLQY